MSNLAMMMGLGSAAGGVNVADVFSTDLYTGTSSLQTITNGVDLSSNGGFVWTKSRTATAGDSHYVFDTERGASAALFTNLANGQSTASGEGVVAFNSDGFDVNGSSRSNTSGVSYVSWTFRKAPQFFDCVSYTGDAVSGREIPHNLNGEVGMMFVKCTSLSTQWRLYHRSYGGTYANAFPTASQFVQSSSYWADTTPSTTSFTVGNVNDVNGSGQTYVAYLFGHGDNIQCGEIIGDGTADREIDLGFTPQFVALKRSNSDNTSWLVVDSARGINDNAADPYLNLQQTSAEGIDQQYLETTANGFRCGLVSSGDYFNASGSKWFYMAIKAED